MSDDEKIEQDKEVCFGQLCYDELPPAESETNEGEQTAINGQLSFEEPADITPETETEKIEESLNTEFEEEPEEEQPQTAEQTETDTLFTELHREKESGEEKLIDKSIVETEENEFDSQGKNDEMAEEIDNNERVDETAPLPEEPSEMVSSEETVEQGSEENSEMNYAENNSQTEETIVTVQELDDSEVEAVAKVGSADGGDGIILKNLDKVLHESMIPYTEHVVLDRALPRVEDGLKPVQRRILYTMLELGITPEKPHRKSARIVGDCMGKYHPHGDSSVYDAMVRMAQDFSLRSPLIDGHGNFGSVDGDSAAAMRYTEAKLTPLAMELLRDLEKNTVRWGLNFDDSLKEPEMLPGRFPNLLVNGASGIAVGVATEIPPHNLAEVIDGVVSYIENPSIKLGEMMKIIKGPDFPTGGILITNEDLVSAYATGRGRVTLRAKVHFEENKDKKSIVITEIPYQVNKASLLQKIAELRDNNKELLSGITEIRDESDRNGMRAVIRLRKEANASQILAYLFKSTQLQKNVSFNMVAIADGKPRQLGLLDIISYYTEYQRSVIYNRTRFDLDAAKDRAHIVEGLLIAIRNIDEVIKIIKTSAHAAEAKQRLRERFKLSEKQTQAIMDMRLARLVNLEVTKLEEELKFLKEEIARLTKIIESKRLQLDIVKEELLHVKFRFKNRRRTEFLKEKAGSVSHAEHPILPRISELASEDKECVIAIAADNSLKRITLKNYEKASKEIEENSPLYYVHTEVQVVESKVPILIFTNMGNAVKILPKQIEECKWRGKGLDLRSVVKQASVNECAVSIVPMPSDVAKKELIQHTKQGMVKITSLSEYDIAKTYFQAIKLKQGDEVIKTEINHKKASLLLISEKGMALHFDKNDIPMQGRVTGGVKAMALDLDEGDKLVSAIQIEKNGALTTFTAGGYGKRIPLGEFEKISRARKGVRLFPTNDKDKDPRIVFAEFSSGENPHILLNTMTGQQKVYQLVFDNRRGMGKKVASQIILAAYRFKT